MNLRKICLVLAGLLMCGSPARAEIYQWVDEKGSVHFSDQPPQTPARKPAAQLAAPIAPQTAQPLRPTGSTAPRTALAVSANREILTASASPVPQIREMLRAGKYAELNALLEQRQEEAAKDVGREEDLFAAYEAFAIKDPVYEAFLDRWVEKFPQSSVPYLARAQYFSNRGWDARGYRWASETSENQFQRMRDYFTKSGRDIQEALQRRAKGVVPYSILLGMLDRSEASGDASKVLAKALAVEPASMRVRTMYLIGATPRWGGTYENMREFADAAKEHAAKNSRLAVLQGYVAYDMGDLQYIEKNYSHAESLLTQALSYGDYWLFFKKRAQIRFMLDKNGDALRDINRAIELWPHGGESFLLRSKILVSLKRMGEALRDAEQADLLRPGDDDIAKQKKRLAGIFEQEGYALQKNRNPQAAIGEYNSAARATPESATIYVRRARALIDQNKLDEALADLNRAVDLDPHEFDTVLLLDWVLTKSKDWDRIIRGWDRYISLHPDNGRAYVERGGAYYHKGDMNAAVLDAKKAADLGDANGREAYKRFKGSVRR